MGCIRQEEYGFKFTDDVDWSDVSVYQNLSQDFMREFKDKLEWDEISVHQKLSNDFIREFKHKLDIEYLLLNHKITQKFYNELMKPKNRFELMIFDFFRPEIIFFFILTLDIFLF